MFRKLIMPIALAAALSGCASLPPSDTSLALLEDALDAPPESLKTEAAAGGARAQYALSIVYRYGLNGVARDAGKAGDLKRRALASRGIMPITQYIAGLNGKPGRTAIINVPRFEVSAFEAGVNDRCAAALDRDDDGPSAFGACGGEASFHDLKARWLKAHRA